MIAYLMAVSLLAAKQAPKASHQPCVWPNRCAQVQLVQVQPCVWPNRCSQNA